MELFVGFGVFLRGVGGEIGVLLWEVGESEAKAVRDRARQTEETEMKEDGDGERDKWLINSFHYPVAATEYSSLID